MSSFGTMLRRRSQEVLKPQMPRKAYSRQTGKRTQYQQLLHPREELKCFRRKQIFFQTQKPIQSKPSKTHRYPSQLSEHNTSHHRHSSKFDTIATMHTQSNSKTISITPSPIIPPFNTSKQEQSHHQLIDNKNNQMNPEQIQDQGNRNQGQNDGEMNGYMEGNQANQQNEEVEDEEDDDKLLDRRKKYRDIGLERDQEYDEKEQYAMARMDDKFWQGQFKNLRARHEDNEFLTMFNHYKIQKKQIIKESSRKVETYRLLANLRKAQSLPKLANISQKVMTIPIPSYEELKTGQRNEQQIRKITANRILQGSVSSSKLMPRPKNTGQNYLQEEINQIKKIQQKFRQKGLNFDGSSYKKALLNLREIPTEVDKKQLYHQPIKLISNPLLRNGL